MNSQHEPRILELRRVWAIRSFSNTQSTPEACPSWYGLIDLHHWPRWKKWLFRLSGCRICLPPKV